MKNITDIIKLSPSTLALLLILLVGLGLRLYGVNWDQGHYFHPDERSIFMRSDCMYRVVAEKGYYKQDCMREHRQMVSGFPSISEFLDKDKSPLNPHWFPLGSIIIYLLVGLRFIMDLFADTSNLPSITIIARIFTSVLDTASIFMVYMIGRRMYNKKVGLLASALVSLAVIHIQISNFYRPEPLIVLFILCSIWFMLEVLAKRRLRDSALLGIFVGLVFTTKVSTIPLFLPLICTYGFRLFTTADGKSTTPNPQEIKRVSLHALVGAMVSILVFIILMPYAIIDYTGFTGWIFREADIAKVAGIVPYTVQYIGTKAFLYEFNQTTFWGLGIALGIISWAGLMFTIFYVLRGSAKRKYDIILLSWVLANLLIITSFEVKFLRYSFTIIPILILMGSRMLILFYSWANSCLASKKYSVSAASSHNLNQFYVLRYFAIAIIAFVVLSTAFYAFAFVNIFSKPHSAVQASQWIDKNVPKGSTILNDNHWDESIPSMYGYKVRQIPIYEGDNNRKARSLANMLASSDYLVFYSNRTYGSVARVSDRYPYSSRYYKLLFSEKLGYKLLKSFNSYPNLLGVSFIDDTFTRAGIPYPDLIKNAVSSSLSIKLGYADNDVITYDHPMPLVFKNVSRKNESEIYKLLSTSSSDNTVSERNKLMLGPNEWKIQSEGGTWKDIINTGSIANRFPVISWFLAVELIYILFFPLAFVLFNKLSDRGVVLARPLGLVVVGYLTWLLSSLKWAQFSSLTIFGVLSLIALISAYIAYLKRQELILFIRQNLKVLIVAEALYIIAFLSFVLIRMNNPDLWHSWRGGEKPMDFAYLNAIVKSVYMPPFDPWFAGGYINYYYWGQYLIALIIKMTGIMPSVAYNLAIPLLFSLTVTGAFSVVYNLVEGFRIKFLDGGNKQFKSAQSKSDFLNIGNLQTSGSRLFSNNNGSIVSGILGGFFVGIMGNFDGIIQIINGAWIKFVKNGTFPHFDFWASSRIIPNLENLAPSSFAFWLPEKNPAYPDVSFHITEFPYWGFTFADLHAHIISIPIYILALGLILNVLLNLSRERKLFAVIPAVIFTGLVIGSLWTINTWDYPSLILISFISICCGLLLRPHKQYDKPVMFIVLCLSIILISKLSFLPFHNNFENVNSSLAATKWNTPILNFLTIYGFFIFVILSTLVYITRNQLITFITSNIVIVKNLFTNKPSGNSKIKILNYIGHIIFIFFIIYMSLAGYWTVVLMLLMLGLCTSVLYRLLTKAEDGSVFLLFPLILITMSIFIAIGVDLIRVQGDIGRMNTVFKYYNEIWVFWGISCAFVLGAMGYIGLFKIKRFLSFRTLWIILLILLLIPGFIYPILGTNSRVNDRMDNSFKSLDGTKYMETTVHHERGRKLDLKWDLDVIRWFQSNVKGTPIVLEAHTSQYFWGARIANYTGLPTILGWPWHQRQQRMKYGNEISERERAIKEIYTTSNAERAEELMDKYGVNYIVVGQLERALYPHRGTNKFSKMKEQGLIKLAYSNDEVNVYER